MLYQSEQIEEQFKDSHTSLPEQLNCFPEWPVVEAHTAELSSSGGAMYCPNSDTYGENIGRTHLWVQKRCIQGC